MAVLYKHPGSWGLPSLYVECVEVETYLRLAETEFYVEVCSSSSRSPSGQLPALEKGGLVAGLESSSQSSRDAREACLKFARRHCRDLDERLTIAQKAEVLAYTVLIRERLELAIQLSLWVEPNGFAVVRKAMQHLPFPLNYFITWGELRRIKQLYSHLKSEEVYAEAQATIASLAGRIGASIGPFFFGQQPSSLDAVLASTLAYIQRSPAVVPELRKAVLNQPPLCTYIDYIMSEYLSEPAPSLTPEMLADRVSWGNVASAAPKAGKEKRESTAAEKQVQRGNNLWLLGVGAAAILYMLFGGQYLKLEVRPQGFATEEDDEDEDADDAEDE